ncbi:MAG TPA: glycosyltransferase family 39 protein [Candidatus Binataceae bacterium]
MASSFHTAVSPAPGSADAGAARRRELTECAALGLLALAAFFFHLGSYGLWEPDEGRYAEIAREMMVTGNFIVPHLNYVPYIEKPPLLYWTTSLAFHFLGTNEFAARLVPALSALLGVIVTYWFGRRIFDHRRGLLAAAILITSPLYATMAQVLTTDMLLTAMLSVAFFAFYLQWREGGRWWIALYLAMALAVLTKGPVGAFVPVLAGILFLWRQGALRGGLGKFHVVAGTLILAAMVLPWFAVVAIRLPGFLDFYIIGEHFRRVFVASYSHDQPFYFFLPVIIVGLMPWSICFPLLLHGTRGPARAWCAIVSGLVLVLFSAAQAKLIPYILPALPPIALLLSDSILCAIENRSAHGMPHHTRDTAFITTLGPALGVAGIGCLAVAGAAPYFHNRDITILARVVALSGVMILIGGAASSVAFIRGRFETGLTMIVVAVVATLLAGTYGRIEVEALHSYAPLSRELASRAPDATLIDYHRYPQAIPFYTRRRVLLAGPFLSELRFGAEHSADRGRYFLNSDADLLAMWARDRSAVLIIDEGDLKRLAPQLGPIRIIAAQGHKRAVASVGEPD